MTASPKRRWFRFGLQTMFVVVTLIACWLGWNLKVVQQRRSFIATIRTMSFKGGRPYDSSQRVPWIRRLMGDSDFDEIWINAEDEPRARKLFPEALMRPGMVYKINPPIER